MNFKYIFFNRPYHTIIQIVKFLVNRKSENKKIIIILLTIGSLPLLFRVCLIFYSLHGLEKVMLLLSDSIPLLAIKLFSSVKLEKSNTYFIG